MVSELLFNYIKTTKKEVANAESRLMQRTESKAVPKKPKRDFAELESIKKPRSAPTKKKESQSESFD
jgi:hypothetical protein